MKFLGKVVDLILKTTLIGFIIQHFKFLMSAAAGDIWLRVAIRLYLEFDFRSIDVVFSISCL